MKIITNMPGHRNPPPPPRLIKEVQNPTPPPSKLIREGENQRKPKKLHTLPEVDVTKLSKSAEVSSEKSTKYIFLISVGVLNLLHGLFHVIQFIQSAFIVVYATQSHHQHNESFIDSIMHSPIFALIMGVVGILTLVIGIKDYRHHKKCNH
jgi:hypothetical protein